MQLNESILVQASATNTASASTKHVPCAEGSSQSGSAPTVGANPSLGETNTVPSAKHSDLNQNHNGGGGGAALGAATCVEPSIEEQSPENSRGGSQRKASSRLPRDRGTSRVGG